MLEGSSACPPTGLSAGVGSHQMISFLWDLSTSPKAVGSRFSNSIATSSRSLQTYGRRHSRNIQYFIVKNVCDLESHSANIIDDICRYVSSPLSYCDGLCSTGVGCSDVQRPSCDIAALDRSYRLVFG